MGDREEEGVAVLVHAPRAALVSASLVKGGA